MVNNAQEEKTNRLSMRHSIMVWVAGAILGWFVAVVSVWGVLRTGESNIAENTPQEDQILPGDAEKMEQVLPAAGAPQKDKTPEKTPEDDEEENPTPPVD